jgi:heat shock protein HtpX
VVAVTSGLLGMMNRPELEGVIAHELSHVGNKDMLVSTVAVVLVGFVTLNLRFLFAIRGLRLAAIAIEKVKSNPILAIIAIALIVLAPIVCNTAPARDLTQARNF